MRLIRLSADYIDELIAGRIGTRGPQLVSSALTLGSFDGLHRGHQALIGGVRDAKERLGLAAGVVFTFLQHPRQTLDAGSEPFLLTTWREKLAVFQDSGCDVVVAADFCPALSRLDYRDFTERFLVDYLGMRHLVAGHDVHLGADRGGTAETLAALGENLGYTLEVFPAVTEDALTISSSAIRRAVTDGDVALAGAMLGRPYALWGEVTPGDRRGHAIGYPTANIRTLDDMKLLPAVGVYAVRVQVPGDVARAGGADTWRPLERVSESLPEVDRSGGLLATTGDEWAVFGGMLNFGRVPTFHDQGLAVPRLEAHIFGFDGDLRGRNIKVEWVRRLRGEQKFSGIDTLVAQLARDEVAARAALGMD